MWEQKEPSEASNQLWFNHLPTGTIRSRADANLVLEVIGGWVVWYGVVGCGMVGCGMVWCVVGLFCDVLLCCSGSVQVLIWVCCGFVRTSSFSVFFYFLFSFPILFIYHFFLHSFLLFFSFSFIFFFLFFSPPSQLSLISTLTLFNILLPHHFIHPRSSLYSSPYHVFHLSNPQSSYSSNPSSF